MGLGAGALLATAVMHYSSHLLNASIGMNLPNLIIILAVLAIAVRRAVISNIEAIALQFQTFSLLAVARDFLFIGAAHCI